MSLLDTLDVPVSNSVRAKLKQFDWGLLFVFAMIASIGVMLLYGAAGGAWQPWALNHMVRFGVFATMMVAVALVDVRVWYGLAWPAYGLAVAALLAVELFGKVAMGAQRWLEVGPIQIQPSEFTKIATALAIARYYNDLSVARRNGLAVHIIPLVMIAVPAALIMSQPDLGTALMVVGVGATLIILAGLAWRWIIAAGITSVAGAVVGFFFFMSDFQKERVFNFLDPSRDPLGTGYHITQSKIAIGSGGLFGVGYMQGTQSQLDFLPERHTDFILAMLLEEFGMVGGLFVLGLYAVAMGYGVRVALQSRETFGKMLAAGITMLLFIYIAINAGMIVGLLPVVGEALPILSHGGSVMMSMLFGFGLIESVKLHRSRTLGNSFGRK